MRLSAIQLNARYQYVSTQTQLLFNHTYTHEYAKANDTWGYEITAIWIITSPNMLYDLVCGEFLFYRPPPHHRYKINVQFDEDLYL
jgi:hypothetical protein